MKRTLNTFIGAVVAVMALLCVAPIASRRVAAQSGPGGAVPRMADGHPDLSGVWWAGHDVGLRPLDAPPVAGPATPRPPQPLEQRPLSFTGLYQPWAAEKRKTLGDKDDPSLRCVPVAFGTANVSLWGLGFLGQIVQTPKFVVMLTETYHSYRIIPTD